LFMSVHPVLAALAGVVFLGQWLHPNEWAGIAVVIAVNAVSVSLERRGRPVRRPVRADAVRRPAGPYPAPLPIPDPLLARPGAGGAAKS
jgi:inner membrane transporter RhtA